MSPWVKLLKHKNRTKTQAGGTPGGLQHLLPNKRAKKNQKAPANSSHLKKTKQTKTPWRG